MPVNLPNVDPKRELARKLADITISKIPLVGDYCSALVSVISPSEIDKMREKWRSEITNSVNNIEKLIDDLIPAITLSKDASSIGYWISQNSENGCPTPVNFDCLQKAFPDAKRLELEDACGELEFAGLAELSATLAYKVRIIRPTIPLFEVFDPAVFPESNPKIDAALIARYILAHDNTVSADEMVEHFGWPLRRLNPAVGIICLMIGEGRKSAEINPDYFCRYVMPSPVERAELRHFANTILGTDK